MAKAPENWDERLANFCHEFYTRLGVQIPSPDTAADALSSGFEKSSNQTDKTNKDIALEWIGSSDADGRQTLLLQLYASIEFHIRASRKQIRDSISLARNMFHENEEAQLQLDEISGKYELFIDKSRGTPLPEDSAVLAFGQPDPERVIPGIEEQCAKLHNDVLAFENDLEEFFVLAEHFLSDDYKKRKPGSDKTLH